MKAASRKPLALHKQTVRQLTALTISDLEQVQGGQMHTSFSCGNNLCTTH
ncbi:MAG TPA: hypothetical protein VK601_30725 [Kofleriaceae bacterium]|nr:hypothetical protein [Kofleriaceae bacterium]